MPAKRLNQNTRIEIIPQSSTPDQRGGNVATPGESWMLWAEGKVGSGSPGNRQEQMQWEYDYKFTVRYFKSKPVTEKMIVKHLGISYSIRSINLDGVGQTFFQILTCDKVI